MKKFASILMVLTTVASTMFSTAFADTTTSMQIDLDGKAIQFDVNPYVQQTTSGGVTLVEMRTLFEAMGLKVVWNADNPTQIEGQKDGLDIVLHFGSDVASVNGKEVTLAVAPQAINGHTMVPLRFIGEASGKNVKWQGGNQVDITNSAMTSSTGSNTQNPSTPNSSSSSTTDTTTSSSDGLDGQTLKIYFNGTQVNAFESKTPLVATRYKGFEETNWNYLLHGLDTSFSKVNYDPNTNDINISSDSGNKIVMSSQGIYVNGAQVCSIGYIIGGSHYAPIKPIVEGMGYTYLEDATGVYITSK